MLKKAEEESGARANIYVFRGEAKSAEICVHRSGARTEKKA